MERLGRRLEGEAMLRLASGDPVAAARILRRARLVHATPAVRALGRLGG